MSKKQALLVKPAEGELIKARLRTLGNETLETKMIRGIDIQRNGREHAYLVKVEGGATHRMETVGQNPKYLVFYNGQPLATCGQNYVPLFNQEIEGCVMDALKSIGRKAVSVRYDERDSRVTDNPLLSVMPGEGKTYRWRMTATLEKDFEVPLGHLRQSEKFDWGVGITNSYDLSEGVHVYMYLYRQICSNGLYAWSVSGKKNFIHVEKEQNHEAILDKITEGVATIVEEHGSFFTRLDEMSKVTPSREQTKLLLKRLGIRKYEAAILADRGITVEFDKSDIKEVQLDSKVNSEYDLLNALTAMSQDTNTMRRQLDLQTGLMEKILQARTIVPAL